MEDREILDKWEFDKKFTVLSYLYEVKSHASLWISRIKNKTSEFTKS